MALEPRTIARRALAAGLLGVAGYYAVFAGEYSALDLRRLSIQQDVESARLAETRAQVDSLRGTVQALEDDPFAIETLARERFGMIKDGERLYRFVPVPSDPEDPAAP